MIQQEYRDSAHKQENAISSALKGAIVVGAVGAALAYQPWGRGAARFLGRVSRTISKAAEANKGVLPGEGSYRWTKTHYKRAYENLKRSWAEAATGNKVKFNVESSRSLASLIRSVEEHKREAQSISTEIWRKDVLAKEAFDEIEKSSLSKNEKVQVRSFTEEILKSAMNMARNEETARQHKLEGDAKDLAIKIAQDLRKKTKATLVDKDQSQYDYSDMIAKRAKLIESEIEKQAYSLENLTKFLGSVKGERQGTSKTDEMIHRGISLLTGSRRLSWRDTMTQFALNMVEQEPVAQGSHGQEIFMQDVMMRIAHNIRKEHGQAGYEQLMDLAVDADSLFITEDGKAYSKSDSGAYWRKFLSMTRNTLPGKLFKIGDIDNALRIPAIQMIRLYANDPVLRDRLKIVGEEDKYHFRIGETIYTLDENKGTSYVNEDLNDGSLKFVSGKFGFFHKNIEAMRGMTKTKLSDNPIYRMLDVFQDREEYSGSVIADTISMFTGENARRERFAKMLHMTDEEFKRHNDAMDELLLFEQFSGITGWQSLTEETKEYVRQYIEDARKVSQLFRQNTHKISKHVLQQLLQVQDLPSDSAHMLKLLIENDDTRIINSLTDYVSNSRLKVGGTDAISFLNKDLRELVRGYQHRPDQTRTKIELVSDETGLSYGTDSINVFRAPMGNETYYFMDSLKREMTKEVMLRFGFDYTVPGIKNIDYTKINKIVEGLNLADHDRDELEKLTQYGIFQDYTGLNGLEGEDEQYFLDRIIQISRTDTLFRGSPNSRLTKKDLDIFRDVYSTTVEREVSILEGNLESDIAGTEKLDDVVTINRSVNPLEFLWHVQQAINNPLDILKSINEGTIRLSGDTENFEKDLWNIWNGLTANREDMSNANLYTFIPFWFTKRLSDELNKVGLGFSSESTSSAGQFAMSFITKRALPIFAASTYLDWTDDTTREITGHGLWEGFTAGVANVDLGIRRGISALGMDDWLKEVKSINPIWQYWGDHDEYQGYEERQDYYQNGYTPVRKAAWSEVGHAA